MSDPHLLRAVAQALADPPRVLAVVVEAEDRRAAVHALQERYGWDEHQSEMVMDMSFKRATRADRSSIMQELRLAGGAEA